MYTKTLSKEENIAQARRLFEALQEGGQWSEMFAGDVTHHLDKARVGFRALDPTGKKTEEEMKILWENAVQESAGAASRHFFTELQESLKTGKYDGSLRNDADISALFNIIDGRLKDAGARDPKLISEEGVPYAEMKILWEKKVQDEARHLFTQLEDSLKTGKYYGHARDSNRIEGLFNRIDCKLVVGAQASELISEEGVPYEKMKASWNMERKKQSGSSTEIKSFSAKETQRKQNQSRDLN